ncbi:SKOR1 protein, partial [Chaetorhynchus papuensis]|nr:SKOR1 protein [Chaetorhynchus papuensis]
QPRAGHAAMKPNQVGQVILYGIPIVSLVIDGQERLCLAQISNTLLKNFSYNEIHNRRVALGITCVQCTPVQLEILRRAGAMPISSRRCGMITKREAERLCKSFLGENRPPKLPDNFAFDVSHECAWGCRGSFIPARYNSSRAKCIKCSYCSMYFSPNKFIFHSHRTPDAKYTQPDAANFNSWRRHLKLSDKTATEELSHAWEDVKAMFNGGTRKRTFSLQGAAAGGPGAGSPAAKAALHPPPPAGPELAPAHKSLRCSGQEAAGERGALGLAAAHGGAAGAHGGAGAVRSYPPASPAASDGGSGGGGGRVPPHHPHLLEAAGGRKAGGGYHHSSAFRPVGGKEDSESLAKLHGGGGGGPPRSASPLQLLLPPPPPPPPEDAGCERHPHPPHATHRLLSPGGTSCSFASEESSEEEEDEEEEDEPEVDVEGHKPPEEEEEDEEEEGEEEPRGGDPLAAGGRFPPARGLPEKGGRERPVAGPFPRPPVEEKPGDGQVPPQPPAGAPRAGSGGSSPTHHPAPEEQPLYKDVNALSGPFPSPWLLTPPSRGGKGPWVGTWMAVIPHHHGRNSVPPDSLSGTVNPPPLGQELGEHTQETNSPHSLKKDVENMGKEELQKVLFEQIDLRRRLEQEFQVLKGNASFPVFNNFQDQMKRELAYREEMVQQLQIV